jgi:hypothetical protein
MAHIVLINDADGELVDIHYYCSDFCAKHDTNYCGWYGCVEIDTSIVGGKVACLNCEAVMT